MNIGILTPFYPDRHTVNSGIANHFATLAQALANKEHCVTVIHIRPAYGNEADDEKQSHPLINIITLKVAPAKWVQKLLGSRWTLIEVYIRIKCMWVALCNIKTIAKKYRLDVLETTNYYSLCYLYFLFKKQKLPIAVRVSTTFLQIMDDYYPFKSRLLKAAGNWEIKMIKRSKNLVTHTHHHALELEKLYGLPASKFSIVPHGTVLPALPDKQTANSSIKILFVGRLEYRKGIDVLLAAIPLVLTQHPDAVFELIGTDTDKAYESAFVMQHSPDITKKVLFSGAVSSTKANDAYADCDIFVAPSRYESFGLIFIEAMSYGKPVIGCRVGGVPEIITDHENGLFTQTDDAADLAHQIITLIANPDLTKRLGHNARLTVKNHFTEKQLADNSLAYYNNIIESFKG